MPQYSSKWNVEYCCRHDRVVCCMHALVKSLPLRSHVICPMQWLVSVAISFSHCIISLLFRVFIPGSRFQRGAQHHHTFLVIRTYPNFPRVVRLPWVPISLSPSCLTPGLDTRLSAAFASGREFNPDAPSSSQYHSISRAPETLSHLVTMASIVGFKASYITLAGRLVSHSNRHCPCT
ncbi:hypothetical protein CONLIGDRAFT_377916 [Coniochaeta ligniaria NRRL 30616]|uniref:Uncharacterized protein n=1 Tax=Coniochaeta ligniaria NRRL 30616 TaxID=1408157 RepID=A0A1J7ILK3_9PEZI|nr:hypothetical protein CONLIGDRAFT_377916 [Coniochaeta ligniaria NRRL 30616]